MWETFGGRASGAATQGSERPSPSHRQPAPPFSPAQSNLPTHYRAFRNHEWEVVERSLSILQASDFYWGPLSVGEAHARLAAEPVGTYLIRDSAQGDCLFSLSVKIPSGPVSLRIAFQKGHFWLNHLFSDCVVRLLEMVVEATQNNSLYCKEGFPLVFSTPLRRNQNSSRQQELCQQTLNTCGAVGSRTEHRTKTMEKEVTRDTSQPWQEGNQLSPRIHLLLHHQPK
ncbi:suppressor of cytokine signaling 1-like [Macrotis lagotis]|uniref:suppressor of cytokine signaling 1-like n=1 Tax=Macrotis lagotis TaxID=92651 RepID=UPI003D69A177